MTQKDSGISETVLSLSQLRNLVDQSGLHFHNQILYGILKHLEILYAATTGTVDGQSQQQSVNQVSIQTLLEQKSTMELDSILLDCSKSLEEVQTQLQTLKQRLYNTINGKQDNDRDRGRIAHNPFTVNRSGTLNYREFSYDLMILLLNAAKSKKSAHPNEVSFEEDDLNFTLKIHWNMAHDEGYPRG